MHGLGQPAVSRNVSFAKETGSFCHVDTCIITTPGLIGRRYRKGIAKEEVRPGKPGPEMVKAIMLRHGLVPV